MSSQSLVVGLPSLNESATIGNLAVDLGRAFRSEELTRIIPDPGKVSIVNADCSSDDGTPEAFMAGKSGLNQEVISVGRGKGRAIGALLEHTLKLNADGLLLIDSDLPAAPKEWMTKFLQQAAEEKDLVFPRRPPTWNGGDLTYQFCFPMLAGVWKSFMHEPICGDVYISNRLAKAILEDLPAASQMHVAGYGIDFFIATHGTAFDWGEVFMDSRKGNPLRSFKGNKPTMGNKFIEVFGQVQDCFKRALKVATDSENAPLRRSEAGVREWSDGEVPKRNDELERIAVELPKDISSLSSVLDGRTYSELRSYMSARDFRGIPFQPWFDAVLQILARSEFKTLDRPETRAVELVFLGRVIGHYNEIRGKPTWYGTVEEQAEFAYEYCRRLDSSGSLR